MRKTEREPYEPPRIRRVRLTGDDLAAAGCKSVMITPTNCQRPRAGGHVIVKQTRGS